MTPRSAKRSCHMKVRYPAHNVAIRIAGEIHKQRGTKLRVYWCNVCNGWHFTKQLDSPPGPR